MLKFCPAMTAILDFQSTTTTKNQNQYLIRKSFREQFHQTCGLREENLISANQNHWHPCWFLNEMKIIKKNIGDLPNNISAKFATICSCSHSENMIEMLKANRSRWWPRDGHTVITMTHIGLSFRSALKTPAQHILLSKVNKKDINTK